MCVSSPRPWHIGPGFLPRHHAFVSSQLVSSLKTLQKNLKIETTVDFKALVGTDTADITSIITHPWPIQNLYYHSFLPHTKPLLSPIPASDKNLYLSQISARECE